MTKQMTRQSSYGMNDNMDVSACTEAAAFPVPSSSVVSSTKEPSSRSASCQCHKRYVLIKSNQVVQAWGGRCHRHRRLRKSKSRSDGGVCRGKGKNEKKQIKTVRIEGNNEKKQIKTAYHYTIYSIEMLILQ